MTFINLVAPKGAVSKNHQWWKLYSYRIARQTSKFATAASLDAL